MFCRKQTIGVLLLSLGIGILLGVLIPSCIWLWLAAIACLAAGVLLSRC